LSIGVIIEHHVQQGCRDAVRALWEKLLRPAITANASHEAYAYMYDVDDPDVIRAFQQCPDTESAAAFLATPAYATYVAAVEDLLTGPPVVTRTDIIWTKKR
jgi:quinol monooxygenase YgiN